MYISIDIYLKTLNIGFSEMKAKTLHDDMPLDCTTKNYFLLKIFDIFKVFFSIF